MLNAGDTFGRLTVIEQDHVNDKSVRFYKCQCNCDKKSIVVVREYNLKNGITKSCGCLRKKSSDFVCPQCGDTKYYAKGLCRNCYERKRNHRISTKGEYPTNLLVKIGIRESDITPGMKERMDELLNSNILTRKNATEIILGIYKEDKTETILAKKLKCTRQNISAIAIASIDELGNPVYIDFLYDNNVPISDSIIRKQLSTYEEQVDDIKEKIKQIRSSLNQKKLIRAYKGQLPAKAIRALNRVGIQTISDLILASKVLPHTKMFRSDTYNMIVEWAASIGITIGEEFGVKICIK